MPNTPDYSDDPPVTVDTVQRVKPGCEAVFEEVLQGLIEAAKTFEGHLGATVFRSSDPANPEYRIIFKFNHLSNLQRWETSAERHRWLEQAKRLTLDAGKFQILTGLETWFTLGTKQAIGPPPRYKMLVVTFLTIFPLLNLLNFLLQPLLNPLPPLLRSLIVTSLLLLLTTYVVMPRMTKLFAGWLYPKPHNAK